MINQFRINISSHWNHVLTIGQKEFLEEIYLERMSIKQKKVSRGFDFYVGLIWDTYTQDRFWMGDRQNSTMIVAYM